MILIQGESNGDIWQGHIQSVDFINKTVDVYFYVYGKPIVAIFNNFIYIQFNIYIYEIFFSFVQFNIYIYGIFFKSI